MKFGAAGPRASIHWVSAAVLAALVALNACTATTPIQSPLGTAVPGDPLPTLALWPIPTRWACAGVGMGHLTLEGSAAEGVFALENGGRHIPVRWPPGYWATFEPTMVVHDPQGNVIAAAGASLGSERLPGLLVCTEGTQVEMFPI